MGQPAIIRECIWAGWPLLLIGISYLNLLDEEDRKPRREAVEKELEWAVERDLLPSDNTLEEARHLEVEIPPGIQDAWRAKNRVM